MKILFAIGPHGALLALAPASAQAEDVPLPAPFTPTGTLMEVKTRASGQTDPQISSDCVSYLDDSGYSILSGYNIRVNVNH